MYEGLTFKLSLKFPTSYPYEAPQVTFQTPCFHPNVDQYGNICLDILKVRGRAGRAARADERARCPHTRSPRAARVAHAWRDAPRVWVQEKWSAVYNVRTILLSIQSLLGGARSPLADEPPPAPRVPRPSRAVF